jgi:hypothetical protein
MAEATNDRARRENERAFIKVLQTSGVRAPERPGVGRSEVTVSRIGAERNQYLLGGATSHR